MCRDNDVKRIRLPGEAKFYNLIYHFYVKNEAIRVGTIEGFLPKKIDEDCLLYYLLLDVMKSGSMQNSKQIVLTNDYSEQGICEDEYGNTCQLVPYQHVERLRPRGVRDRIFKIMQGLSLCYPMMGEHIYVGNSKGDRSFPEDVSKLLFCGNDQDKISNTINFLLESGYLMPAKSARSTDGSYVMLTEKAWQLIGDKEYRSRGKIFIAMSYAPELATHEEAIKQAIERSGHQSVILKDIEHNNYIPEEFEREIHECVGVIADLTKENLGAYYESGYARALNKPVIFVCQQDEYLHFDISQINTVFWTGEDDEDKEKFINNIVRRIKYTID